ncbi:MAG: mutarotase [Rubrivivax sp.]|nr:MAG: mutarotase [Rubrivivax sp.]
MDLQALYDSMYAAAAPRIRAGDCAPDPLLHVPGDNRCGMTLLLRPSVELRDAFGRFQHEALAVAPELYAHPASDLHVTVLAIVSCEAGFRPGEVDVAAYAHLAQQCLAGTGPIDLQFRGITASPAALMACGFPAGDALNALRNRLRTAFRGSGLYQSIDRRYALATAHATLLRFPEPPRQPGRLMDVVERYRHADFGSMRGTELELVSNDWYQRANRVQRLATFALDAG